MGGVLGCVPPGAGEEAWITDGGTGAILIACAYYFRPVNLSPPRNAAESGWDWHETWGQGRRLKGVEGGLAGVGDCALSI